MLAHVAMDQLDALTIHFGDVVGDVVVRAGEKPDVVIAFGEHAQDFEQGDKAGDAFLLEQQTHLRLDAFRGFALDVQAALRRAEQTLDRVELGQVEEVAAECLGTELDDDRLGRVVAVDMLVVPAMRQIWADEDDVAVAERLDVVADETRAVTADDPGQFEFRVIVPGVILSEAGTGEPHAAE